jgi:hypothetical protein
MFMDPLGAMHRFAIVGNLADHVIAKCAGFAKHCQEKIGSVFRLMGHAYTITRVRPRELDRRFLNPGLVRT